MPTREEMQSLTEEIARSCEDRAVSIAELRDTVKMNMKESRMRLNELRDSRLAMSKDLRADLAKSVADRKAAVSSQLSAVSAELKELNRTRAAMSKELKADLAKSVSTLKQDVGSMLKEFNDAHDAMSRELRAELANSVADRKRDVGAMLKGFDGELGEIRNMQAGVRDEWQKLTATMRAKRGGAVVEVKPVEPVAAAPVEEVANEEAVAHAEVAEITPEITAIRDRVFEYLANHPDGTKLAELEEEFGLARVQMARVVRNLIDENKVEKRGLLYFAI